VLKLIGFLGSSVGGAIGWWLGAQIGGTMSAYLVSMVGTGVGLYYSIKWGRERLR
jgi:hypothetical protein